MLMPSIFGENLLDDFFDYSFGSHKTFDMMNTDIRDTENGYEITMNMPGVRKEDVKAELKDGYLTIQATTDSSRDEKDSNGTYIRRERYCGSCSRSFYVGDAVTQEEILKANPDTCVRIPMIGETRSLNLSNSVAIVLYEALRQNQFDHMKLQGELHRLRWED